MKDTTSPSEWYEQTYKYKGKEYTYKLHYTPHQFSEAITYWFGDKPDKLRRWLSLSIQRLIINSKLREQINYPGMNKKEIAETIWMHDQDVEERFNIIFGIGSIGLFEVVVLFFLVFKSTSIANAVMTAFIKLIEFVF